MVYVELVAAREIGRETVQYVSNIYKYYLAYVTLQQRDSKIELQRINPSDQEGESEDSHEGDGGARFPPPGRARNWSPVDSFFKLFVVTEVSAGQCPPANFIPGLRKKQSLECT